MITDIRRRWRMTRPKCHRDTAELALVLAIAICLDL